MSKRITITDNEITALKSLLNGVLNNYYANAPEDMDFDSFEETINFELEKMSLTSLLKKIS